MTTKSEEILRRAAQGRFGATEIGAEETKEVMEVLGSHNLFRYDSADSKTWKLEESLKGFFGTPYVLAVSNGTAALKAALVGLGIKPGDEILVSPYTFIATINSIVAIGAIPVFVDIGEDLSLDLEDASGKLGRSTKAMISVHIQGDSTDIAAESGFCTKHGLFHLEDCAQAFGAKFKGIPVGTFGTVGCFSLQSNKLVTTGEGGFLITADRDVYHRARNFHDQGGVREGNSFANWDDPHSVFGDNLKISEIQSALGCAQVRRAESILSRLRQFRTKILQGIGSRPGFRLRECADPAGANGVALPLISTAEDCGELVADLQSKGIPATRLYPKLVYEFELYRDPRSWRFWKRESADCRKAERFAKRFFWVLNSLEYTDREIDVILETLNRT